MNTEHGTETSPPLTIRRVKSGTFWFIAMNQRLQSWLLKTPFYIKVPAGSLHIEMNHCHLCQFCSSFAWCISSAFGGIKNHCLMYLLSHIYTLHFLHPYKKCLKALKDNYQPSCIAKVVGSTDNFCSLVRQKICLLKISPY